MLGFKKFSPSNLRSQRFFFSPLLRNRQFGFSYLIHVEFDVMSAEIYYPIEVRIYLTIMYQKVFLSPHKCNSASLIHQVSKMSGLIFWAETYLNPWTPFCRFAKSTRSQCRFLIHLHPWQGGPTLPPQLHCASGPSALPPPTLR